MYRRPLSTCVAFSKSIGSRSRTDAVDANAATGCKACPPRRDRYTGWGRLDVAAALQGLDGPLPSRDRYEPNDEAAGRAVQIFEMARPSTERPRSSRPRSTGP